MALPKVTTPAQGATHNHMIAAHKIFSWDAGNPPVVPNYWRVKVGATPGSWNYYMSNPAIAESSNHQDINVVLSPTPPIGKTCYVFVEWGPDNTHFPNQGDITSFVCKP
jgi:hypothetical protein